MTATGPRRGGALLLAAAALFTSLEVARLAPFRDLGRRPETPYDRTQTRFALRPTFGFLTHAAAAVPRGTSATIISEPRDAVAETSLHFAAVALLPGRRVLPSAEWDTFTPQFAAGADYVLVFGPRPAAPPGSLVLAAPGGTVWKRPHP